MLKYYCHPELVSGSKKINEEMLKQVQHDNFIMPNKNKKFVIIDGNAIVHRAYHAIPPLTAKDGTMINAVYGFTSMLLKVIHDLKPDYLAVAFDVAGGTFRHEVSETYKATRVKADQDLYDQIPLCYQIVEAFDIPIYTKKGFEADDVISTIVDLIQRKANSVVVTGDMDLLQIVDAHTQVYALRKGISDAVLFDAEEVKKKYGFGPEHIVDYKSLRGDSSDNIIGVSGIGEKTATELIQKIGGIDEIYKQLKEEKSKLKTEFKSGIIKKLEDGKADAKMSHELATIVNNVPDINFDLDKCVVGKFNLEKITELFRKFEFFSLLKRVPGVEINPPLNKGGRGGMLSNKKQIKLIEITKNNSADFTEEMKKTNEFACKEIINGKDILNGELFGLIFITKNKNFYLKNSRESQKIWENIFTDKNKTLIGHDLKKLNQILIHQKSFITNQQFDTMIASYLLNSSNRAHDLKSIIMRETGEEAVSTNDQTSLFGPDSISVAKDFELIYSLKDEYTKQLKETENLGLFQEIEMKLIPVLAEMEMNGVAVDKNALKKLSQEVNQEIVKLTKKIWEEAGEEFNIASSVQLRDILFEKLELPTQGIKKGKTGYSTADPELDKLIEEHTIITLIREYRELTKLQNTYVDVLPKLINKKTNRIHTTYNQAVTTTGRLSSSDPNLQNIPIRTKLGKEVRNTFVAEPGNILIAADYSQIELRIVASLAQDKKMIEIFEKGEDIHSATAAAINGVKLANVTKEMRYAAKEVNFGVLYGMGAYGLSWRTKIPQWQAKEFINKYFSEFSGVKKYLDQTLKFAHEEGYVETLFGRRRYIPELQTDNHQLRNAGERMAINMPIQGTAADLMKMAMIKTRDKIHEKKYKENEVRMILQVHDELVLEVKKELAEEIAELVKTTMEQVTKLRVPIEVHVDIGKSWGELK